VSSIRVPEEGDAVRRRRRCAQCDKRSPLTSGSSCRCRIIVKKNGSRTELRAKLRGSLMPARASGRCRPRRSTPRSPTIEESLPGQRPPEVDSGYVGELVMQEPKRLDKIAYIRFASVYKNLRIADLCGCDHWLPAAIAR
jgi:transcriptional repressor NrdR